MITAVGLLLAGGILVYLGAELAVRGLSTFARRAGLPIFVLGALAFGIDLEGTGTAAVASARGETQIAVGSIFGSVLFLWSAAFGAALLAARTPIPSPAPGMVVAPSLPVAAATIALTDRYVTGVEGLILIGFYALYVVMLLRMREPAVEDAAPDGAAAEEPDPPPPPPPPPAGPRLAPALAGAAGIGILAAGAAVLVDGGSRLVALTALFPGFVGAAVIGVLTSIDEVLLEVVPVRRGLPELATGNLLGTLAAFSSGVLGLAAVIRPLDLDGTANAAFLGAVFLYAVVAVAFLLRGRAGRLLGAFVLAFYALWLVATASV